MRIRRVCAVVLGVALVVGCRSAGSDEEEPDAAPSIGVRSPIVGERQLAGLLEVLEAELASAEEAESEDAVNRHVLRAEAISDQLLEANQPFERLASGYSVEARLRQLQAMADRVVSQLRRDEVPGLTTGAEVSMADVTEFRAAVHQLRVELQAGGGPAPPPLDSLLAGAVEGQGPQAPDSP